MRGSWRLNRTAIYWPPHLWPSALCLSRSPGLLNRRPRGPALCWMMAFFTVSYHQLVSKTPSRVLRAPSARYSFPYHVLSPTSLIPNSIRGSESPFGLVWLSLPHLVSNSVRSLSDFLSWPSYIIVECPLNRPLNLWNGMFDRHQVEITVMQFRGHSLPVHQSMSVSWDFYLVPFHQPNPPTRSLSITGHWNVSLPSGASLWNGMFGRVEGQNTTNYLQ